LPGSIEPEKEIVLTVARSDRVDTILEAIVRAADLNTTGRGIAFVIPVEKVVGVAHFIERMRDEG
jgi:nitrogen regulatory protein PII